MGNLKITSSAFEDGDEIPRKYGYEQENVSPPLKIENIPYGTKSLTLIMDDPDAMNVVIAGKKPFKDPYVHWVAYNIKPYKNRTEPNSPFTSSIEIFESKPTSTPPITKDEINWSYLSQFITEQYGERFCMLGVNGWDEFAYGGPAPPDKTHTYVFKLYALKIELGGISLVTKADVEKAMEGHILDGCTIDKPNAILKGTFKKL